MAETFTSTPKVEDCPYGCTHLGIMYEGISHPASASASASVVAVPFMLLPTRPDGEWLRLGPVSDDEAEDDVLPVSAPLFGAFRPFSDPKSFEMIC